MEVMVNSNKVNLTPAPSVLGKFVNLRLIYVGLFLKVLLLYFVFMPPMNVLLSISSAGIVGYCVIRGLVNLTNSTGIRYFVTSAIFVLIVLTPPPALNNKLLAFRYWFELAPHRAIYEAQVARMQPDSNGVKRAKWLLSSWWGQQFYILYDDGRKPLIYEGDPCYQIITKISGNFYISNEGCF